MSLLSAGYLQLAFVSFKINQLDLLHGNHVADHLDSIGMKMLDGGSVHRHTSFLDKLVTDLARARI